MGEPTVVARAPDQRLLAEPHLVVHPAQPNHLLAAAMVWPPVGGSFQERVSRLTCAAFLSVDGGKRWEQHDFPVTNCFDPWVAITPDGRAVLSVLAEHPALLQQGRGGWALFHSPDGGHTWDDAPVGLGRGHDHSTMVVDATSSPHHGTLYVLSHHGSRAEDRKLTLDVFVARSRDAGKTFDEPVKIVPNNVHNLAEMPVVLSNGTLVVSFVDAGRNVNNFEGRAGAFERRRAWVLRSTDGGKTFSIPLFVNDACGPPPGFQLSALAADVSAGPFRDRLYFACRRHGDGPIVLNYSGDGGETGLIPCRRIFHAPIQRQEGASLCSP